LIRLNIKIELKLEDLVFFEKISKSEKITYLKDKCSDVSLEIIYRIWNFTGTWNSTGIWNFTGTRLWNFTGVNYDYFFIYNLFIFFNMVNLFVFKISNFFALENDICEYRNLKQIKFFKKKRSSSFNSIFIIVFRVTIWVPFYRLRWF